MLCSLLAAVVCAGQIANPSLIADDYYFPGSMPVLEVEKPKSAKSEILRGTIIGMDELAVPPGTRVATLKVQESGSGVVRTVAIAFPFNLNGEIRDCPSANIVKDSPIWRCVDIGYNMATPWANVFDGHSTVEMVLWPLDSVGGPDGTWASNGVTKI